MERDWEFWFEKGLLAVMIQEECPNISLAHFVLGHVFVSQLVGQYPERCANEIQQLIEQLSSYLIQSRYDRGQHRKYQ